MKHADKHDLMLALQAPIEFYLIMQSSINCNDHEARVLAQLLARDLVTKIIELEAQHAKCGS
jgi:hypothetical protein